MENDDRQEGSDISTRLTYLLIGGGIGALLALLFAPKPGSELPATSPRDAQRH